MIVDRLGWIVLTHNLENGWQDDWDGKVHHDYESALASLKECKEGFNCRLGVIIADSPSLGVN